jgi:hypothetical protein
MNAIDTVKTSGVSTPTEVARSPGTTSAARRTVARKLGE